MFKNISIGRKIISGFGLVVILLIVVAVWSVLGTNGIVDKASNAIEGNALRGEIAQFEVDQLDWAINVNELLTDENVTELDIITDPEQSEFGKWLFGEQRAKAVKLVPEISDLCVALEEPYRNLYQSAKEINDGFVQADLLFSNMI